MSQFPAWAAGSKISAAGLSGMEPYTVSKGADTGRASTTALVADPDLAIVNLPAGSYTLDGMIVYTGAAIGTADLKFEISATAGSVTSGSAWWALMGSNTSATTALQPVVSAFGTSFSFGTPSVSNNVLGMLRGTFQCAAGTTVSVLWAQNTSNATATTLRAGSWMSVQQFA